MGLIFFMSSDVRLYYRTLTFSETVVSQIHGTEAGIEINGNTDENIEVDIINLSVRKSAHSLEYLVLSVLLLKTSGVYGMQGEKTIGYVLLICLLIDFGGALMGMVFNINIRNTLGSIIDYNETDRV